MLDERIVPEFVGCFEYWGRRGIVEADADKEQDENGQQPVGRRHGEMDCSTASGDSRCPLADIGAHLLEEIHSLTGDIVPSERF